MIRNLSRQACVVVLSLAATLAHGQSTPIVVSDEYAPTNTDIRVLDVSGVKLGMDIGQVKAMNTNLVQTPQFTNRKDIDHQVEEFTVLEASQILHGPTHVWPGWNTVRIWFTSPAHGSKACNMSFSKELGSVPDMNELESRLCKKYGPWCRKKVTRQDTGATTVRFTWGMYDKQQDHFIGSSPTLDVWVTPQLNSSGDLTYTVTFNLDDPRLKRANTAAVDAAVNEVKVKSVQAIPF